MIPTQQDTRKFLTTVAAAAALTALGTGLAGVASAAPTGGASAVDVVRDLRAQGYNVQMSGAPSGPLSRCTVDRVRGLSSPSTTSPDATRLGTVVVEISCPDSFSNN